MPSSILLRVSEYGRPCAIVVGKPVYAAFSGVFELILAGDGRELGSASQAGQFKRTRTLKNAVPAVPNVGSLVFPPLVETAVQHER